MLLSLLFSDPLQFFAAILALVVGITVHEYSHALAAHLQGDPTPSQQGRVSLNPLKHLDPFGTIFLLFAGFGWGKPVQFNPVYLKKPRLGSVIVGFAGPLANLIIVVVFGLILKILTSNNLINPESSLFILFSSLVLMNVILFVFNLLPIPPLDGSKAVIALLTPKHMDLVVKYVKWGPYILFSLIILDAFSPISILGSFFQFLIGFTFNLVFS